jgi:hypothetical protein
MSSSRSFSLGRLIEDFGPVLCGLAVLSCLIVFKKEIMAMSADGVISVTNLYNAVFGWAAIQTGCLFAMYGFVTGSHDGFIGEARHTRSMKRYAIFLRRALYIGFLLSVTSIPLIVTNYKIEQESTFLYFVVAAWFSLFVWAFCSFARVAYIFGILIKVKEPERIASA